MRHLQVFTELFHLAMKSPVDPTAGTFFEKKNHGPFCVWIQTTNLYPQNKTKIFWQTLRRFIKTTPSWKRCQNITISQKIISGKPHRFRPLTSGVGSSTIRGGGSKHFWMNRCTAARGSADNSNLKASTNSWFCWRDWWSWSFQWKIPISRFPRRNWFHGFELNMKSVVNLNFENTINLNAWLEAKGLGGSWKSCQA